MDKTTTELIEWCKKESNRNAKMQGEKHHTNRRRKAFRYRNHMFIAVADRLEAAESKRDEYFHKMLVWQEKAMGQYDDEG